MKQGEQEIGESGKRSGGLFSGAFSGVIAGLPGLAAAAGAAVGAALVGGVGAAVNFAQQARQGVVDLQASLGVTGAEAERLGEVAKKVFGNNWTGSLAEAQEAVANVRREVKGLSDTDLQAVTEGSVAIADRFQEDQAKVAQAVAAVMQSTGASATEAMDFVTAGFQRGLNKSGDFLDSVLEYSPQFEKAKASTGEFFSTLESGLGKGALGTDKVADAFKEFGFSLSDTSEGMVGAFADLGINQAKLTQQIDNGTLTQTQAFQLIIDKLKGVKSETERMAIISQIFKGAGEDLGSLILNIDLTKTKMGDLRGTTQTVKDATNTLGSVFQTAWRQVLIQLQPIGDLLLDLANEAMPSVKVAINQLGPVVTAVVKFLVDGFRQGRQVAGQFASEFGPQIERAVATFRPVVQAIGPLFAGVFGLIRTLWETVLRPVLTAISPLITGVVASVGNTLNLIVRVVTGVVNAVSALLRRDMGGAVKALEGIFEEGVTFVVRQIRNMGSTILGLIRQLAPQMADAAANIIRGLIGGIEGGAGRVIEAARNLASGVIKGITGKLIIQSPSKALYILGEHSAQGLANGITDKSPVVQKAAKDMATGVITETQKARAELEKAIRMDAWVNVLKSATTAQLEAAQATARSAGEADKYNAIKAELERREQAATAATEKATQAAKAQADQLAANRKAITDGLKFEAYLVGLGALIDAQLAAQASAAKSVGDQQRFNAVLAEQRSRAEETARAVSDLADAQIAAANSAAQRDPQGFTDAAYRQSFGAGDLGLVRSLAAVTGKSVADIRANVQAGLDDAKRYAPEAASIIKRVYADALTHRREAAAEEDRITARAIELANDRRTQIVENLQAEQAAADDARITVDFLTGQLAELAAQGLDAKSNGFLDYLTDLSKGTGKAAQAAQTLLDNFDALWTRAQFRAAQPDVMSDTPAPALGTRPAGTPEPVAARPAATPTTAVTAVDARTALSAEAQAWKDRTEAQLEATKRQKEYRATLKGLTVDQLKAAQAQELQNGEGERYAVIGAEITRIQTDQATAEKAAADAHATWVANLNTVGFREWTETLKDMSAAELQAALDAARASENVAEFNAVLAEIQGREINVTLKIAGFDTGLKQLDLFKTATQGLVDVISKTFEGLVDGSLDTAQGVIRNTAVMVLGIVKQIAIAVAAYQAQAIAMAIIKGASFDFVGAGLALAAAAAVAGIAAGLASKINQSGASATPTSSTPSSAAPTGGGGAASTSNNLVTIPSSQVTVTAAPEWANTLYQGAQMILTAGEYMQRLVTEGITINTSEAPGSQRTRGVVGLAYRLINT